MKCFATYNSKLILCMRAHLHNGYYILKIDYKICLHFNKNWWIWLGLHPKTPI